MKQDLNGVRTAQDLEQKYDLGVIEEIRKETYDNSKKIEDTNKEFKQFTDSVTKDLGELHDQVDGNITTWFQSGVPTLDNYPANEWITEDDKVSHLGDLYYDRDTGYSYRFNNENGEFNWLKLSDSDISKALAIANSAQDTADSKRRVFLEQPTPPYDSGDMWIKDKEIYICQISKPEGEVFAERDFINELKYTDDTYAEEVDGKLTILSGTVTEIRDDVDELSKTITNTTALVDEQGNKIGLLEKKQSATIQTVDEIKSNVEVINKELISTAIIEAENIEIADAIETPLVNLSINGKSYQKTRSGKNEFDNSISPLHTFGASSSQIDTGIKVTCTSAITNTRVGFVIKDLTNYVGKTVRMKADFVSSSNNSGRYYIGLSSATGTNRLSKADTTTSGTEISFVVPELSSGQEYLIVVLYGDNGANTPSVGDYVDYTNMIVTIDNDDMSYERYGASPSPDYPSEIISVGNYNSEEDKYLLELNISGKNKLGLSDKEETTSSGLTYSVSNGEITIDGTSSISDRIIIIPLIRPLKFEISKVYKISMFYSGIVSNTSWNIQLRNHDNSANIYNLTFYDLSLTSYNISNNDGTAYYLGFYIASNTTFTNFKVKFQIEEGTTATKYEPYKSSTTQFKLEQPLRSIGDIKDKLYIKNNRLYVERNIGSIIINGNDYFVAKETTLTNTSRFRVEAKVNISNEFTNNAISDYFKFLRNYTNDIEHFYVYNNGNFLFFISNEKAESVDSFKQWLNENNVQADYILATPIIEDLGDFEIPSTYKGINYISTTDNLKPIITLEYVRDTELSNYVEGQINNVQEIQNRFNSEILISQDQIQQSVTENSNNLTEMFESVNQVKQTITSQDLLIEVISKNIDKSTGDIREVSTINGFKFNDEGLNISTSQDGFNALHNAVGSYYKDVDAILSQITKDGIINRDLELYGIFKYGKADFDDEPMFIAQMYQNEEGETGFGHFYNGGGN